MTDSSQTSADQPGQVSQVVVKINDRPFTMQCDPGEEDHLSELAHLIDTEVAKLKRNFGQVGDTRLLLMAGLVVSDKLASALLRIEDLEEEIGGLKEARTASQQSLQSQENALADRIEAAAERIEALSKEFAEDS